MLTEGFRPLAGISCVSYIASPFIFQTEFPSPRGDKLCLKRQLRIPARRLFPSPRGDKLCPTVLDVSPLELMFPSPRGDKLCQIMTATINPCTEFPSPRGDKLCRGLSSEPACPYCFRPLAGISCVEAVQISGLNNPVSVPSRG